MIFIFVCAIAAAFPDGQVVTTQGVIEGRIGYEEKGSNGFGYTAPMQPQQTMQMNLDPNQQVGQPTAQAPQATPQPAPATTATATVTETLHV